MFNYTIAQILPKEDLYTNEGDLLPLSKDSVFDVVFSSIKNWISKFKPSILKEHNTDGESYGSVKHVYRQDDGIYALIELNPEAKKKLIQKRLRYVSPGLHFNFQDNTGKIHPVALMELSLVSVPRFAVGQKDLLTLNKITELSQDIKINNVYKENKDSFSFKNNSEKTVTLSQSFKFNLEEEQDMDMSELLEMVAEMLEEKLDPIMKRLEELEKLDSEGRDDAEDAEAESAEMAEGEDTKESEMAEGEEIKKEEMAEGEESEQGSDDVESMKEKMKFMEEQLAEYKKMMEDKEKEELAEKEEKEAKMAQKAVEVVLSQKKVDDSAKDFLLKLYKGNKEDFDKYVSYLPNKKGSLATSKSVGFSQAKKESEKDFVDRVTQYAIDNGVKYSVAYKELRKS